MLWRSLKTEQDPPQTYLHTTCKERQKYLAYGSCKRDLFFQSMIVSLHYFYLLWKQTCWAESEEPGVHCVHAVKRNRVVLGTLKKQKTEFKPKNNLTLLHSQHLKQQAVKMVSLKNNKHMLTRGQIRANWIKNSSIIAEVGQPELIQRANIQTEPATPPPHPNSLQHVFLPALWQGQVETQTNLLLHFVQCTHHSGSLSLLRVNW